MDIIKKSKIIQVRISEQEEEMLKEMCEKFGSGTSEFIRGLIREKYMRIFPAYVNITRRAIEEELTDEQKCEQAGGTVGIKEGIPMCIFKMSESFSRSVPLGRSELYPKKK